MPNEICCKHNKSIETWKWNTTKQETCKPKSSATPNAALTSVMFSFFLLRLSTFCFCCCWILVYCCWISMVLGQKVCFSLVQSSHICQVSSSVKHCCTQIRAPRLNPPPPQLRNFCGATWSVWSTAVWGKLKWTSDRFQFQKFLNCSRSLSDRLTFHSNVLRCGLEMSRQIFLLDSKPETSDFIQPPYTSMRT